VANLTQIPQVPLPKPPSKPGGLGEKIFNLWVNGWVEVANQLMTPITKMLQRTIENTLEGLETEAVEIFSPIIREVRQNEDLPQWAKNALDDVLAPRHPIQLAALIPLVAAVLIALVMAAVGAVAQIIQYAANRVTRPFRIPFQSTVLARRRGFVNDKVTRGDLYDVGLTDERITLLENVSETHLDPGALGQLTLRGEMQPAQMVDELFQQGWKREHAQEFVKLLELIPSPNDLIAMAVKEAWDDRFAALTGADEQLPGDFITWAGKQGLSPDWCKRYWRAHWQLPSAGQGFEMFHRGIISDAELDQLLKALDISPFWRGKLRGITYAPYTRVDVRRLFNKNILTREQVKRNYLDLGYDDTHAENLTDYTIKDATGTDREATKTDILSGYSTGMLSKSEAVDWLIDLDFPRDLAEFYIAKEDAKREVARRSKRVEVVHRLYAGGDIASPEASTRLTGLGLTGTEIDTYLEDWKIERDAKTEKPSPGQLETLLKQDIIMEADYRAGLLAAGWQDKYVTWLTSSVLKEKTDAANVKAQQLRLEQERLRTARAKSSYAVAKSALDTELAEAQVAISETQVALAELTEQYTSDLAIARGAVSVATLQQNAAKDLASLQAQIDDAGVIASTLAETVNAENQSIAELTLALAQKTEATNLVENTRDNPTAVEDAKTELKAYALNVNTLIAKHRLTIEQVRGDIAVNATKVDDLRAQQDQRKARLADELDVAARVKSVSDLTAQFNAAKATYTETLGVLRGRVTALNVEKAKLAQTLQAGLKVEG
jgi:hypothetical protein